MDTPHLQCVRPPAPRYAALEPARAFLQLPCHRCRCPSACFTAACHGVTHSFGAGAWAAALSRGRGGRREWSASELIRNRRQTRHGTAWNRRSGASVDPERAAGIDNDALHPCALPIVAPPVNVITGRVNFRNIGLAPPIGFAIPGQIRVISHAYTPFPTVSPSAQAGQPADIPLG